jgi:outer membrane protein insertion porin family
MYWGTSFEVQIPIFGLPKDFGMRFALFADAGSVWNYRGPTAFANGLSVTTIDPVTGKDTNTMTVRSSVGAGFIWDSPFGPIYVDYAFPPTRIRRPQLELRFSAAPVQGMIRKWIPVSRRSCPGKRRVRFNLSTLT